MAATPLERRIQWQATGDVTWPLVAEVDGERWRIRLGDFPTEAAYTLVIGDEDVLEVDAWPNAWHDPRRAAVQPAQASGASSVEVDEPDPRAPVVWKL